MRPFLSFCRPAMLAVVLIVAGINLLGQEGYPYISRYSFEESIDNDNYDVIQDNNLNVLIANRKGILSFDSRNWDLLPLPYFPVVLSKSPYDGSIFAGCRNGFGQVIQDVTGAYSYVLLSDTLYTGEISEIQLTESKAYFINENAIYKVNLSDNTLETWDFSEASLNGSFIFQNEFYFLLEGKGLFKAEEDTFKLINNNSFTSTDIEFTFPSGSKDIYVVTSDNEIFRYNGTSFTPLQIQNSEYLKTSIITDGVCLSNTKIALGTLMGGVVLIDQNSGLTLSIINTKTGLKDDEIYCLGSDNRNNLWVCHPYGISYIDNHSDITNLSWYPGLSGNLTNAAFFNHKLYLGSNDGLYLLKEKRDFAEREVTIPKTTISQHAVSKDVTPAEKVTESNKSLSKKELRKIQKQQKSTPTSDPKPSQQKSFLERLFTQKSASEDTKRDFDKADREIRKRKLYSLQSINHNFEKVNGISGKCSEMLVFNNHILASTYNGLYDIKNDVATTILPNVNFNFLNPSGTLLFAGSRKSLYILQLKSDKFEVAHEFTSLDYSVYSACFNAQNEIWLGGDNSVHKLIIDPKYNILSDETIPIATQFSDKVILRKIGDKIYLFLSSGIYTLENNEIKTFKTFDKLSAIPQYYFSDKEVVWYRSSGKWEFITAGADITFPGEYLNIFKSIQDIYMGKNGDLYIVANNQEIYKVRNKQKPDADSISIYIASVKGGGNPYTLSKPEISYTENPITIKLASPFYFAPDKTEYSYKLDGISNNWSEWTTKASLEYPMLPPGDYTLLAKARNIFGQESGVCSIDFRIKPPFYRTVLFYVLMVILILGLFFLIMRFRLRSLQKAKEILEQKVKERTAEIERQKNEISEQKKEITDSIQYARRIQTAVLPSTTMLNKALPDHFVLFQPKDIVSGDFYFSAVKDGKVVILAADCTGHGVPGAFMSMLGISFLNEIVSSHKLDNAASILNRLRDYVKSTLSKSGDDYQARDGMDIALCIVDHKEMKLQYAGAYNPLYMIRKSEITEIKANKMPIGNYDVTEDFNNNSIDIVKNDSFYIFSDGFIDQFGGDSGKKYLSKQFKELLVKVSSQPMSQQKELIKSEFDNWKGNLQQIDDVLVIGFKI